MQGMLDVPYGSRRVMPQPALLFTFKIGALISCVCCARLWASFLALGLLSFGFWILVFGLCLLAFPIERFWRFCIGRWSAWDVGFYVFGLCVWASVLGLQI